MIIQRNGRPKSKSLQTFTVLTMLRTLFTVFLLLETFIQMKYLNIAYIILTTSAPGAAQTAVRRKCYGAAVIYG